MADLGWRPMVTDRHRVADRRADLGGKPAHGSRVVTVVDEGGGSRGERETADEG